MGKLCTITGIDPETVQSRRATTIGAALCPSTPLIRGTLSLTECHRASRHDRHWPHGEVECHGGCARMRCCLSARAVSLPWVMLSSAGHAGAPWGAHSRCSGLCADGSARRCGVLKWCQWCSSPCPRGTVRTDRNQRSTRTALMNPVPRKKWTIGNEGNPRARIAHDARHAPHPRIGGNSRASNAGHSATRLGGHMVCGNPFRIHMVGAAPGHSVYSGREIWLREAPGALHPRGSRHVGEGVTGVEKGREGRYPPICPSGRVEAPVRRPFVASREGMPRNNYPHV